MRRLFWVVFLVIAFIIGGLVGSWARGRNNGNLVPLFVTASAASAQIGNQVNFGSGFVPVARKVLPVVVNVSTSKLVRPQSQLPETPFFNDPFFRQFFGNPRSFRQRPEREQSLGSGVIVSPDGYILTNNHVVEGASDIKVSLSNRQEYTGKLVGTDPKTDIAVVKISAANLPVITLGDSSKVEVGQFALAFGNPFGVGETMTMGIVSATGRGGLGIETYEDFIQTDASINPGNSGGALTNVGGELVGVNTAILTGGGGGNAGVGFAVPVNMARHVMDEILKHGKVVRGWMGVEIQPVTPAIAKSFNLPATPRGALVSNVTPNSPAARAGLQQGDIIVDMNGQAVTDSRQLSLDISNLAPGTRVNLTVFRNGRQMSVPVTLGEMPTQQPVAQGGGPPEGPGPRLGLSVDALTPQIARQLGISTRAAGVVVTDIDPAGPAAAAGLQRGDVIQSVNHKSVASPDQFVAAVRQAGSNPILLLIDRGGDHVYVVVEPGSQE